MNSLKRVSVLGISLVIGAYFVASSFIGLSPTPLFAATGETITVTTTDDELNSDGD